MCVYIYLTWHEKYFPSHFSILYVSYTNLSIASISSPFAIAINKSFIGKRCLSAKLCIVKVKNACQSLCAHKPYSLIPIHVQGCIYSSVKKCTKMYCCICYLCTHSQQ